MLILFRRSFPLSAEGHVTLLEVSVSVPVLCKHPSSLKPTRGAQAFQDDCVEAGGGHHRVRQAERDAWRL